MNPIRTKNGQIIRLKLEQKDIIFYSPADEFINGLIKKGAYPSPGFQMFPRIGTIPGYTGDIDGKKYSLDGHGVSRLIEFEQTADHTYIQTYNKERLINPKAGNGNPQEVFWPFSYTLESKIKVADTIKHDFLIKGERQPFQFGTHPNFLLPEDAWLECNGKKIDAMEIVSRDNMLPIVNADEITLVTKEYTMTMKTYGFGNFQLWTKGTKYAGHICIEPVTHIENKQGFVKNNYLLLEDEYKAGYELIF